MIHLTDSNGRSVYLALGAIATVVETGASSQWHGVRAIVKTFDGRTIEVNQTAAEVAALVQGGVSC